jgi:hypothetical protein
MTPERWAQIREIFSHYDLDCSSLVAQRLGISFPMRHEMGTLTPNA